MALIDVDSQFDKIKKSAVDAVQSVFPIQKQKHKLELSRVWVEDNVSANDYTDQAKTKAKEGSWGANVYADLKLIDVKTGKTLDQESKVKLFLLPKLTPRGSYIVRGNEYQVANQLRLKSGAYAKTLKGGGYKTQFNLAKGGSAELHISDSGIVQMKVKQGYIPLYPLLIGLGISDNVIKNTWGQKVWETNRDSGANPQNAIKKLAASFANSKSTNFQTAKEELQTFINNKTEILPEMTKITLGKEHSKFTPQLWLDASKKLIEVERGDQEPDDVDNLAFKEFFGIEDALKERIEKNKTTIVSKINRNLDYKTSIKEIITLKTLSNLVESFFTEDDRSATPEQINPLHMYAGHERVTFLGPGSISSTKQVTEEMRNVHPTHFSYLDPVHTPESDKIGLSLGLTMGAKKVGKELRSAYWNVKNKKFEELTAQEVFLKNVAYPDQWDPSSKKFKSNDVKVQTRGKINVVGRNDVDYVMPFAQNAFSLSTNLIPFMANDNGNRTMMAGKHMEQAIPLKNREIPLVQNKMPIGDGTSFEEAVGSAHSVFATKNGEVDGEPIEGVVTKVEKDGITIRSGRESHKINLYNNFPLNQKTFITHEPKVKVGDKISSKQILADSNFTKDGTLALGINLKAAYLPYKGYNFEDGIVITESAAKKLTSEHIHRVQLELGEKSVLSLSKFLVNFPNEVNMRNRDKLDEMGIIKKGANVEPGDVIIAAMKDTGGPVGVELIKSRIDKSLGRPFKNAAEQWTSDIHGKVVDVIKTANKVTVHIKTEEPARIGDKLAGRHGNKGIITKILPDNLAPQTKDGSAVDIILNPHGVISRINIGQMYESAMGKVSDKKGQPFKIANFTGENYLETVKNELKNNNIDDLEDLVDPETGKDLGKVHVGKPYILKLNKQSEVNFSVRGESGPTSKTSQQPIRGGEEGSKSLDMLTLYSMLSHGARANLSEMATIKSENNPEFWEALKFGRPLPAPKTPFVFEKFVNMLKGAGVDVEKNGSKFILSPLTDSQVKELSSMEIKQPSFFRTRAGKLIEEKGGFVDSTALGGVEGKNWAHIKLKEPIANPIFEDAIKTLTGLVKDDYSAILKGAKKVDIDGKQLTGGFAIKAMLDKIDVAKEKKAIESKLSNLNGTARNNAIKKFRFLNALEEKNISPSEAYIREYIPVVPPKFRPISAMGSGDIAADDVNWLYRNVALLNKQMNLPVTDLMADEDLQEIRSELNNNVKALVGLESVRFAGKDKSGFIHQIKGKNQPKEGFFQSKVLRKNQNLVGRGTIIPEPQLHMDEVALPEKMAWKLYMPFTIKELVSQGLSAQKAKEAIDNKTPQAKLALDRAMSKRPVMLNRAPSLHKFSIMAFKPKITHGTAIKIPPLVVSGFNADFDGDTMTVHVPIKDAAVREAFKMMPSRNLWKPGTGTLMVGPSQESQLGFYLMTKTPEGRAELNKILPDNFDIHNELDKKASKDLFMKLSKELSNDLFAALIDKIKVRGEQAAFEKGFTLGIKDLEIIQGRDGWIKELESEANKVMKGKGSIEEFSKKLLDKGGVQDQVDKKIKEQLKDKNNALYEMVNSGARGSYSQLRQIVASPLIVQDPKGGIIAKPITKSFAEGLDLSDYWIASYGARKGMMDRALSTQEPGVFNKSMAAVTMDNVVSMDDCGTTEGIMFPVNSSEILGRFVQGNQAGVGDESVIDEAILKKFKQARMKEIFVRSPLKCKAPRGTCRHCYGVDENGKVVSMGDNLGAKAGQTIAEPLTQMTMNTFHTGGVAGTGKKGGYARVNELLAMPKKMKVGKSVLATVKGKVEKIEPSGLGGFNVFINGKKHITSPNQKILVKVGDEVKPGDQLNSGAIAPQELLEYKGMEEVQNYLTNELQEAYKTEGINIDRKTFETIVRSVADRTYVINNAKGNPWLPGESIPYSVAMEYNKNRKEDQEELIHEPYLKGIKYLPEMREDWMAQMGATHIKNAIVDGASQGWFSDTRDYHPIPAFAAAARFGDGEEGKY